MIKKIQMLGRLHHKALMSTLTAAASSLVGASISLNQKKFDELYDLAVIGGGSGGLATAFQAAEQGLKTIVIDFVEESQSPYKTKWGLGGTCVNVGCIPKKLFHQAAKHRQNIVNASDYGWILPNDINARQNQHQLVKTFSWKHLRNAVLSHIKSINFGYTANIHKDSNMDYLNAMATFVDHNTLLCSKDPNLIKNFVKGQKISNEAECQKIRAKNFVIATGTRPMYLPIKGANLAISSDDIFMKKQSPGKTLVVGGGYVGIEVAGFLKSLGYEVTLMTRGKYLRSFDQDMVEQVMNSLRKINVNIVDKSLPKSITKSADGSLQVQIQSQQTKDISIDNFNTVLFAVGRQATTSNLNLQKVGVETSKSKKIITRTQEIERTKIDHIYALGDVVEGLPQLTSTAVKMGQALGRRIAHRVKGIEFPANKMFTDISNYPTTIFSPLEFSTCGLSEEKAINDLGRDNIEVYHIKYQALEEELLQKYDEQGNSLKQSIYVKAVVDKRNNKVVGLHFTAPNAGQIMQGFAVALKMGMTKQILDDTIGIHPTVAQSITMIEVTKQSGKPFEKTSC